MTDSARVGQSGAPDLVAIAESAWRVRNVLNLNLLRIAETGDEVLGKNLVDALNDLNATLPPCEDGPTWRPQTRAANAAWGWATPDA